MEKKFAGTVFWDSPYIIYCPFAPGLDWWGFDFIQNELKDEKVYFLKNIYWSVEDSAGLERVVNWMEPRKNSNHQFIWLANSQREVENLGSNNIEAYLIHQNSFIDPNLFHIIPSEKKYSAVYNAALMPYKRVELAKEVDSVALISRDMDPAYFKESIESLKNIVLLNELVDAKLAFLPRERVNEIYSQSSCGLCLSAYEGAMFASLEYLLSGLPVVTTPSIGGRDFFFTRSNSIFTENDSAQDVASAVRYWTQNLTPLLSLKIRQEAIERQQEGVVKLKTLISRLLFDNLVYTDVDKLYRSSFVNALARHLPADQFLPKEMESLALIKNLM